MGSIIFSTGDLADSLSETAGSKAGLALSVEQICDHLSGSRFPDVIRSSELGPSRVRAEDYESMFYKLLYRIGHTPEEFNGDVMGAGQRFKYLKQGMEEDYDAMMELLIAYVSPDPRGMGKLLEDPIPFVKQVEAELGSQAMLMAIEKYRTIYLGVTLNPHSFSSSTLWTNQLHLDKLVDGTKAAPVGGNFIDQRFVNYLAANTDRLSDLHWRLFESLTAEFYSREGYRVELGPGSNDDGVDVRVWDESSQGTDKPLCLIQCKRHKGKIDRVTVKGLHSDVEFEGAQYGVIVTTSELSPGARSTIAFRGYPIREVNREAVINWLQTLRKPGTGIVRV